MKYSESEIIKWSRGWSPRPPNNIDLTKEIIERILQGKNRARRDVYLTKNYYKISRDKRPVNPILEGTFLASLGSNTTSDRLAELIRIHDETSTIPAADNSHSK